MKKYLPTYLLVVVICLSCLKSRADETPVVLREWAAFAGNTDSAFVVPVLNDGDYTYSATYKAGLPGGVDLVLTKYDKDGHGVWQIFWTGSGVGRDQPSDMVMDEDFIYLSGITYSSANNYDFLTMQIAKSTGTIGWVKTYNSSFSNYDVATSIGIFDNALYVTGVSYRQTTLADYHTIKYNLSGDLIWERDFDYASLMDIPFDLSISEEDTTIVITGASQSNLTDWDYQTVIYDSTGTIVSQPRTSGSAAGFDRASAVKTDENGFIYITGATRGGNGDFDIKTVKLYPNGNLVWADTYDSGGDDMGNDLLVDKLGNVYICGESHGNDKDFFVRKTDANRNNIWIVQIDGQGYEDIAYKMCFDSDSNIIVTGKGFNPQTYNYDFLTVALKPEGGEMWRDYFDGPDHGTDEARNIVADTSGNIFVTGQVEQNSEFPTVTIKYRTDFFINPSTTDTAAGSCLFYPNEGQLLDQNDSLVTDSTHYYTLHYYPQLYFGYGEMNMVFSKIDADTATADTLQRVDVSFLNSTNLTEAFPVDESDSSGYLNYFLGHCPNGIVNVKGSSKLLYTDVYDGVDAEYASNYGGLKLLFIINPNASIPGEIGLKFEGQNSIAVLNNWQLRVSTSIGSFDFEKPKVYQLDANGSPISISWHLNWGVQNGNEATLSGWGSYDSNKPLVVEISKAVPSFQPSTNILYWSTYYGGVDHETAGVIAHDERGFFYTSATTASITVPLNNGYQTFFNGGSDILLSQFTESQSVPDNLKWATFFGGSGIEEARGIAINNTSHDIYFTGTTNSTGINSLPTWNQNGSSFFYSSLQSSGGLCGSFDFDAFLARINEYGINLIYSTYIGGAACDGGFAIAVNQNDESVYLGGYTQSGSGNSPSFPIIASANSNSYNQSSYGGAGTANYGDGFLMKFDNTDECVWSTYFGGNVDESVCGISITSDDKVFITGFTNTSDAANPTTTGQPCLANANGDFPDCDPGGTRYYDGSFNSTAANNFDCFVAGFTPTDQLVWSTYFGGWADDHTASWNPIAAANSPSNKIAITGATSSSTASTPFPQQSIGASYNQTYSGNTDAFVAMFENFSLIWSTAFGGTGFEQGVGVTFDEFNQVFITGTTNSATSYYVCAPPPAGAFPICDGSGNYYHDDSFNGGTDAFIAGFDNDHQLIWSTYVGGSLADQGFSITASGSKIFTFGDSHSPTSTPYPQVYWGGYYWQNASINGGSDQFISMFKNGQVVAIEEFDHVPFELAIFPNPAKDEIQISLNLKNDVNLGELTFRIFDLDGRIINNGAFEKRGNSIFQKKINLNGYSNGMYFVRIESKSGFMSAKFVKQ